MNFKICFTYKRKGFFRFCCKPMPDERIITDCNWKAQAESWLKVFLLHRGFVLHKIISCSPVTSGDKTNER